MQSYIYSSNQSIEELFGEIICAGIITQQDRLKIKSVLLNDCISEEHHAIIDRIVYNVRRGFLLIAE